MSMEELGYGMHGLRISKISYLSFERGFYKSLFKLSGHILIDNFGFGIGFAFKIQFFGRTQDTAMALYF
jgi:hypothetical protein